MEVTPLVAAFADSPALRETLSVLLEHECTVRFFGTENLAPLEPASADLAVVAMQRATGLLTELTQRWPGLPIIAVETAGRAAKAKPRGVDTVPLEPHAIRTAVMQRLPHQPQAALRAAARVIAGALREELTYSFTALRSFAALQATGTAADTSALFAAILREQSYVIGNAFMQLQQFRARPRTVERSSQFAVALCREMELPDRSATERGLLCQCTVDRNATAAAGPVTLVPLLASLLRSHLRRRSDSPIIQIEAASAALTLAYPARPLARPATESWPLQLVSLALRPYAWRVVCAPQGRSETVVLRPA